MSFHRRELSEQLGAAVGWAADRCDDVAALSIDGLGMSSTQLNARPGPVTIPCVQWYKLVIATAINFVNVYSVVALNRPAIDWNMAGILLGSLS